MANCSSEPCERKAGLTGNETSSIALVTFLLGMLLAGIDYLSSQYMTAGSYDGRILPFGAAVLLVVATLAFINLDRFQKSLWELIAVPSPLYGALACGIVAAYEIGKLFQLA